jgi:hypothetical protein
MFALMLAVMPALPAWQDDPTHDHAQETAGTDARITPTAEGLRSKVHKLRMDLILGGDQVQRAEGEAVDFYSERLELIDRRLDRIDVDLSEKRASYQLALGRTVESPTGSGTRGSIREASRLRAEIVAMERESANLQAKRDRLASTIDGISDRGIEREAMAANLEANNVVDLGGGLPMSTIGFGPGGLNAPEPSPFDDPQLVLELVALDPQRGRTALFAEDPEGYWQFFDLRPPAASLREALVFPPPDLPGKR